MKAWQKVVSKTLNCLKLSEPATLAVIVKGYKAFFIISVSASCSMTNELPVFHAKECKNKFGLAVQYSTVQGAIGIKRILFKNRPY